MSDIILKIELENRIHDIHVLKRPGAEEFIDRMSKHYELVIFTASLSKVKQTLFKLQYLVLIIISLF